MQGGSWGCFYQYSPSAIVAIDPVYHGLEGMLGHYGVQLHQTV